MHRVKSALFVSTLVASWLMTGISSMTLASENIDNEAEINRLKKEMAQLRIERQRVKETVAREKKEFAEYRERTALRKAAAAAEIDSIRRLAGSLERNRDSLEALIETLNANKKNAELSRARFRDRLIASCKTLHNAALRFPPSVSRQSIGALTFLINDCTAGNIDAIEGLQRLVQIIRNLEEAGQTIQTGQVASEVPQIRGAVSMLRIGAVFEAVIDEDGKKAAVWQSGDFIRPAWTPVDAQDAAMIFKAIAIRENKAMPSFVPLPFGDVKPKGPAK